MRACFVVPGIGTRLLSEHPRERDLRRRRILLFRDARDDGAAHASCREAERRIGRFEDLRLLDLFEPDVVCAVEHCCFHDFLP